MLKFLFESFLAWTEILAEADVPQTPPSLIPLVGSALMAPVTLLACLREIPFLSPITLRGGLLNIAFRWA